MIDFIDRVSSGKKILKYENGTTEIVTIENAEDATVEGTPINRANLMAVQGFQSRNYNILNDGTITMTTYNGNILGISPLSIDGTQEIFFVGEKTITVTAHFNENGTLSEVVS